MERVTCNLRLAKLSPGKKLDIKWQLNRAIGPNVNFIKSRCTFLVCDVNNAQIKVKEWAEIQEEKRIKLFEQVLVVITCL